MAKIRDFAVTINATAGTSLVCNMPTHQVGDLLLAFVSKDLNTAFTAPGGWTNIQSSISTGAAGGIYGFRATTTTTAATFTLASAANMAVVVSVSNVNGSTVADAVSASSATAADDTSIPYGSGTLTPLHTSTLVFSSIYTNVGIGIGPTSPWVNVFSGDAGANSLGVAYSFSTGTSVVTGTSWYPGAVVTGMDSRAFMIAIRDSGTFSNIDAYVPLSTTAAIFLSPVSGQSGAATADLGTWIAGNSRIFASIGGLATVSNNALSVTSVGDTGYTPFRATAQTAGISNATQLAHTEFTPTTAYNLTQAKGIIFGTYRFLVPRDYIDIGTAAQGGVYFVLGNGTTTAQYNCRAWAVGGQFSVTTKPAAQQNWAIQLNQTINTRFGDGSAGTVVYTTSSIARIGIGSAGVNGAPAVQWSELHLLNEVTIAGGSPSVGITGEEFARAVRGAANNTPVVEENGSALTLWCPIKFGGVEPCSTNFELVTLQFPKSADKIDYLNWHVDPEYVGIEFHGRSGDSFIFNSCVFTSPTTYYWRFNAAHSTATTLNFVGTSVVNARVGLTSSVSLSEVTFNNCKEIPANGASLTGCTIIDTSAGLNEAALTISGTSQTALQTELNKLTNLNFTNNVSSSGALEIFHNTSTTGTVTLSMSSGNFSGNTKDIYWVAATGTNLVLNVSGTANPTTFTSTNANSVTITLTKTFAVTNIIEGTELRIFKQSDLSELAGAEVVGASPSGVNNLSITADTVNIGRYKASYSYNFSTLGTSSLAIFVVALAKQYQWLRNNAALTSDDGSLQIAQQLDRQYTAGSIP